MEAYQQIKVLGKGSFGAAWLVKRRKDGTQFVAKEVKLANMKPQERAEAKHEITMLRTLNNFNITRYVDNFEHRGSLFIVMEYANGGDLYTKIQSRRGVRFTEKEVLHYFCQLCNALYHMHEKHILHRDLKTQNVFMTADGVIKLGDFGISTVLRNTYELKRTVCGTPYYFSPELCMNKPYNNKSDIWALGCILYELTTLNHAFDGTSMKALVQRILRGVYPPIHSSYSKELRDLIAAMLNLDPHKRPHIAHIITLPFVKAALQNVQSDLRAANEEKRSCVDEGQRAKEKAEAARRASEEKAARERKEREYKAQQEEREKAHKERVAKMRDQMAREVREHEEKLKRIREEQKMADEKRKAEAAERQKRLDEERRLRDRRRGEIEVENRKREEQWEANMRAAREDAERRRQEAEQGVQAEGERRDERVRAHADAYRDARQQAAANRQRALEAERAERERAEAAPRAAARDAAQPAAGDVPQKQKQQAYDQAQARDAYYDMRRAAQENRHRAEAERRGQTPPSDPAPVASAAPAPAPAAVPPAVQEHRQRVATPQQQPPAAQQQQRADAFWEMRRAAEANRRRLLGLDPEPAGDGGAPPDAAAPVAAAPPQRPPSQPTAADPQPAPLAPPGVRVHRQAAQAAPPQPARAPTPPDAADDVPTDEDDDDGDVGFHKFLNNDAAAEDEADHNASRQADYKGVDDDISRLLNAAVVADDFQDEAEMGHFKLDGRTLQLPNVSDADPMGHRIETLRMVLEESLGDEAFLAIYRLLSRDTSGDNAAWAEAEKIAGDGAAKYVPVVVQLIMCEEEFARKQNQPTTTA